MEEIYNIEQAIDLLKEKLILKDSQKNTFVYKRKRVYVYSNNSYFSLDLNDFYDLYKDSKFIVEDFDDSTIDPEKDNEYYSFKHK
jgi:hypothetical protein